MSPDSRKHTETLRRQMALNESRNLLHPRAEQLLEIDPAFQAALEELLGGPAGGAADFDIDGLAADAASALIERIQAVNPYIQIDGRARNSLKRIYVQSWRKIVATRDIESVLRSHHYPKLKAYLADLYPPGLRQALASSPTLGRVPCSEYSADLQMRLFKLDPSAIIEPLLDIGCGSRAYLVNYLRSRGLEAYGIDRAARQKADFLTEIDWFEMPLGRGRWGTIVSNLAFTNHLVYAERYDKPGAARYLKRYAEILDSLAPGGSFIYAPSVESLEARTDGRKFHTEKWAVAVAHALTKVTKKAL